MHKKKMVHRDIKLDNILVKKIEDEESFDVKVADFGLARFMPFEEEKSSNIITM
jgi:serine/threonine protein kinase